MAMTIHAAQRAQQRGISPLILDLLLKFGRREPAGDGTEKVFFDKRARKRLNTYSGGLIGKLSDELDAYAIVARGDKIITAGAHTKRINRI